MAAPRPRGGEWIARFPEFRIRREAGGSLTPVVSSDASLRPTNDDPLPTWYARHRGFFKDPGQGDRGSAPTHLTLDPPDPCGGGGDLPTSGVTIQKNVWLGWPAPRSPAAGARAGSGAARRGARGTRRPHRPTQTGATRPGGAAGGQRFATVWACVSVSVCTCKHVCTHVHVRARVHVLVHLHACVCAHACNCTAIVCECAQQFQ